jgi:carbamoyl-phosphate synthase large subunit
MQGEEKHSALEQSLPQLKELELPLYSPKETWQFLHEHGLDATLLHGVEEQEEPNVRSVFQRKEIDLALVVVAGRLQKDFDENYIMRRLAIDSNIPLFTKIKQMRLFLNALIKKDLATLPIKAWDEYRVEQQTDAVQAHVSLVSTSN